MPSRHNPRTRKERYTHSRQRHLDDLAMALEEARRFELLPAVNGEPTNDDGEPTNVITTEETTPA